MFDIGGVTVKAILRPLSEKIAASYGVPLETARSAIYGYFPAFTLGETSEDEYGRLVSRGIGKKYMPRKFKKAVRSIMILDKKVVKIIKQLKGSYKIAALSNMPREWMAHYNERFGFDKLFDFTLTSYELKLAKPYASPSDDPTKMYRVALKAIGLKPSECVFIDDHEENLVPAKKLGIKTILFRSAAQLRDQLKDMGIFS